MQLVRVDVELAEWQGGNRCLKMSNWQSGNSRVMLRIWHNFRVVTGAQCCQIGRVAGR